MKWLPVSGASIHSLTIPFVCTLRTSLRLTAPPCQRAHAAHKKNLAHKTTPTPTSAHRYSRTGHICTAATASGVAVHAARRRSCRCAGRRPAHAQHECGDQRGDRIGFGGQLRTAEHHDHNHRYELELEFEFAASDRQQQVWTAVAQRRGGRASGAANGGCAATAAAAAATGHCAGGHRDVRRCVSRVGR